MKKKFNKLTFVLLGITLLLSVSCQKTFDSKSYAPSKPLQSFGGYTNSSDIEPTALVSYFPFSNSLKDSLSATTGVATKTSFAKGVRGEGLQGANNGYVVSDVPVAVQNLQSFTISLWVKMGQNTDGAVGLFDIDNNQVGGAGFWGSMAIFFDNGGSATTGVLKVHVFSNPESPTGLDAWEGGYSVPNPWNVWSQVVVTYDNPSSTVIVYFNGKQVGTNTVAGFKLDWTTAKKMVFGTLQFQTDPSLTANTGAQGWASYMTGVEDQVRIYNKVLTAKEVKYLNSLEAIGR